MEGCNAPVRDHSLIIAVLGPVLAGVSLLFVIIRVITRRPGQTGSFGLGWDDFVTIAAWGIALPKAAMDPFYFKYGLGRDMWMVPFHNIDNLLRLFYFGELFYLLSVSLTKISLLAFFLRVFPHQTFRRITWAMIGVVTLFTIAFVFPLIFQCTPVENAWLRWDGEHPATCIDVYQAFMSHAAFNMALDIIILVMPMPVLYKVQVTFSRARKIQIFIMFSFGLIVTVVSFVRLNTLRVFEHSTNPTWDFWGAAVWSVIEMYTGVICACIPAAKLFFQRLLPQWFKSAPSRGPLYSEDATLVPIRIIDNPSTDQTSLKAKMWPGRSVNVNVSSDDNAKRHGRAQIM